MNLFSFSKKDAAPAVPSRPQLLWEHAWDLLCLNLICFLMFFPFLFGLWLFFSGAAALPAACVLTASALTAAPARRGMAHTVRDIMDGRCYEPVRGFFRAAAAEYPQSLAAGLLYHVLLAGLLLGAGAALDRAMAGDSAFLLLLWICVIGCVLLLFTQFFTFTMLANIALPVSGVLRNAVLLGFASPQRTLYSLLALFALTGLCACRMPYTLFLLPLCYFSLVWFFCGGWAWETVRVRVARLPAREQRTPEES